MWTCSTINGVNDKILLYDAVFNAWAFWDNWNAKDLTEVNDILYFVSSDDGGLYYYDETSFQDARGGNVVGFVTQCRTKRFDFGYPSEQKSENLVMVQGYISNTTKIKATVYLNENGAKMTMPFVIDGGNTVYVSQVPIYGIGRASLGRYGIGGIQAGTIGFFRVFLSIKREDFYTIQLDFQSDQPGDQWGITGVSFNPKLNTMTPSNLTIGVSTD